MTNNKRQKAMSFADSGFEVELVGLVDIGFRSEDRSCRVEELVAKITMLGFKKGRPNKKDDVYDQAA